MALADHQATQRFARCLSPLYLELIHHHACGPTDRVRQLRQVREILGLFSHPIECRLAPPLLDLDAERGCVAGSMALKFESDDLLK